MPSPQTSPWREACRARRSAKSLNGSYRALSLETPRTATAAKASVERLNENFGKKDIQT